MKANEVLEYALKVKDSIMDTEHLDAWRDFDDQKIYNLTSTGIFPVLHETMRIIIDSKNELEYRAAQSAGRTGEKQRTAAAKKFFNLRSNPNTRFDGFSDLSEYFDSPMYGFCNGAGMVICPPIIGIKKSDVDPKSMWSLRDNFPQNPCIKIAFDTASVKAFVDKTKAECKSQGISWTKHESVRHMWLGNEDKSKWFDAEQLLQICIMLGSEDVEAYMDEGQYTPLYLKSPIGEAILLPMRHVESK